MYCKECGYRTKSGEVIDSIPAILPHDLSHPNYNAEYNCVDICPECFRQEQAVYDAAQHQYLSGIDYACGYRN